MITELNEQKTLNINDNEIVAWKESEPFALSVFRRKQQKLIKLGFKPSHTITTEEHGCGPCGIPRSTVTYSLDAFEFNFEVCPSCWTCCESFPVYDGGFSSLDADKLSMDLQLLGNDHLALIGSIVDSMLMD